MRSLDWSHIQSFVSVAEHGSLSAAARATGASQPTLSRHISVLEEHLGHRIFDRTKAGVTLTQEGTDLLEHAATMADAAARMSFRQERQSEKIEGTVRITASRVVATFLLPDILTALHRKYPAVEIEVVASDTTENLLRREADIAVRMYRPTQEDVISQHVGDLQLAAFATPSYIAKRGMLQHPKDILDHDVIGYDRSTLLIDGLRNFDVEVTRSFFKFRSDDQVVCWKMVCAGFGVGFNQTVIGNADERVVQISGPDPVAKMPLWLTAHPDLRSSPRVRRVFDFLRDALFGLTDL